MTPERLTKGLRSVDSEIERPKSHSIATRPRIKSRRPIGLTRSERVQLEDGDAVVYPSTAPEARRSVDVVVDVHENKGYEPDSANVRKLSKPKRSGEDGRACWSAEGASSRTEQPSSSSSGKINQRRRDLVERGNAWETNESIDAIREFEETGKDPGLTGSASSHSGDSQPQLFGSSERIVASSDPDDETERTRGGRFVEGPKRRRKRWSKGGQGLQLTKELIGNSSDTNHSAGSESGRVKPVAAPRRKKAFAVEHESSLAFDNAAFRSDTEEVLRIETEVYEPRGTSDCGNVRQSTRIEMTNFYESYEKVVDRETTSLESEDEFTGKEKRIESFKASGFLDTSDELETEIIKGRGAGDSGVLIIPEKIGKQDSGSAIETSELSQDESPRGFWSDERIDRKENRLCSERESTSFDTGNSMTDVSDLPGRKSSEKIRPKKREDSDGNGPVKKRKSKRRTKIESVDRISRDDLITECDTDKAEKLISVTIHKADVLETDFVTRHPMVKVHVVEMNTGNYLKTMQSDNHGKCNYLQPLITGKFDFKENRSILPNWQEELIFTYNFDEIVKPVDKPILFLFEILDLLNFAEASFKYNVLGNEGCWHKIAWAFLKPVGANGASHVNKKVRLQLYEPPKVSKKSGRLLRCEVFNWWRSMNREKYPSTLYVTLKPVDPPLEEPIVYERLSLSELPHDVEEESFRNSESCRKSSDLLQLPKWSRLAAQSCKIPNDLLFQSETFENGSFYVAFSNNGKYLASVGSEDDNYPIVVHTIPDGKIHVKFKGHSNFVYALNWSSDDKYLLSVSSDQTACMWDVENRIIQQIEMLPHPSYVYCGKFHPVYKSVVITGCFDSVARVWTKSRSSKRYELSQELDEHKGYVNALCFQKDGGLITADSVGVVILWTVKKREWRVFKTIKNNEIENIIVNTIILHPLGSRLLVHSRDNGLRMIDLDTGVVLQRYQGFRNRRLQTTACLSPCGGLVLCGGEDSSLTVWNLENGRRVARYLIQDAKIVACVAYHPLDHILAFSTFGSISAVRIMRFDKNSTGESVGLSLLGNGETSDDVEITVKFDKNEFSSGDNLNLRSKYAERRTGNSSKVDRSYSKDARSENSVSRQDFLRLKIQRLNESQEGLKSRSAARLNNIIEKIDKILVNTTLKRELDSTQSSNETRRQDQAQASSISKRGTRNNQSRFQSRSSESRNRERSSTLPTDATNLEFIEMQNISSIRNEISENEESTNSKQKLLSRRSFLATRLNIPSHSGLESDEDRTAYKSSSESNRRTSGRENEFEADVESNQERRPQRRRIRRRREEGKLLSDSLDQKPIHDSESCIIALENPKHSSHSNPSTSDSAGTYTIDKGNFSKPWDSDKKKATDTSSSAKSNATFTVENEITSATKSAKKKSTRSIKE